MRSKVGCCTPSLGAAGALGPSPRLGDVSGGGTGAGGMGEQPATATKVTMKGRRRTDISGAIVQAQP
jgi:hypothetical protein